MSGKWAVTKYGFDTDLLWHLKIGEDIVATKSIFINNAYTWLQNTVWTQQEWLFDIMLYGIVSIGGIVGFYLIHLSSQFLYIKLSIKSNKYHFDLLALVVFLTMYMFLPFNQANRPAEYSTYLVVLMIWLYDKSFRTKPVVYFGIGVFIANFHCGAAVALLTIMGFIFAIDLVLNFAFNRMNHIPFTLTRRFIFQYIISCMLFIAGLCINPYGIKQVKNMFSVMNLNSTQYINEWKPFVTHSYLVWIMIIAIAISFGYALYKHKWEKDTTIHIALMSAFLVLSLTSIKGFVMFYYMFMMYGYKYFDEMIYDFLKRMNLSREFNFKKLHFSFPEKLPHKKMIYSFLFIVCLMFGTSVAVFNQKSMDNLVSLNETQYITDDTISELQTIAENKEGTFNILNGYVTGNYLLYHDIPVFIDARQMPYSKEFGWSTAVDDYFDTNYNDYEAMDKFFDKYNFNYVICNGEYNINNYMQRVSNSWYLKYSDTDSGIYIWERVY